MAPKLSERVQPALLGLVEALQRHVEVLQNPSTNSTLPLTCFGAAPCDGRLDVSCFVMACFLGSDGTRLSPSTVSRGGSHLGSPHRRPAAADGGPKSRSLEVKSDQAASALNVYLGYAAAFITSIARLRVCYLKLLSGHPEMRSNRNQIKSPAYDNMETFV
jgi:hypothetical protein